MKPLHPSLYLSTVFPPFYIPNRKNEPGGPVASEMHTTFLIILIT